MTKKAPNLSARRVAAGREAWDALGDVHKPGKVALFYMGPSKGSMAPRFDLQGVVDSEEEAMALAVYLCGGYPSEMRFYRIGSLGPPLEDSACES